MALAMAAIASISAIAVHTHSQDEYSQLTIANIEALSWTESGHDSYCDGPGDGCLLHDSEWYDNKKGDYLDD